MAAVNPADYSVAANGDIRYTGTTTTNTVLEFHRWLQDLADDATSAGDDLMDITQATPSDRSTDNIITLLAPYNIDDATAEVLFDGSIIQANGDTIYDGIVNFGNATHIEVIQNGALIANDFWNLGGSGLNGDTAAGISHRFMVKVRDAGADIDGRRLIGTSREFGFTYSEFSINGTTRGNNVLALSQSADLNNQTVAGTVATWTDVVNGNEGYTAIDVNGDTTDEFYYSDWDRGSRSINQFYERTKWLTRRGSAETLYGLSGEIFRGITHEIDIDNPTGTFQEPEGVSWPTGTGQLLAIDSTTAGTKMWIQLLTGVAPTDNDTITGGTSTATAQVNTTVTTRSLSFPFSGASTGSAIIGAYGLGIEATDLSASDQLFDLTNTVRVPPNNVSFTVNGLVSGEDRVLVGPEDGAGGLDLDQLSLSGTLSGGAVTSVSVSTAIPTDTPSTGTIRILVNTGRYQRVSYTSYSGSTFTIPSTDFSGDNATSGNNVFISYIDELAGAATASFTGVYLADRTLFVRVRDGGGTPIKTFESTGSLGSAGGSSTVIRTSDA
ncbi:MAG: hypothetical protein AAGE52_01280 [Myxococcota bacterium]